MTTLDISRCPELMALLGSNEPETVDGGTLCEGDASPYYADGITLIAEAPDCNVVTLPEDLITIEGPASRYRSGKPGHYRAIKNGNRRGWFCWLYCFSVKTVL